MGDNIQPNHLTTLYFIIIIFFTKLGYWNLRNQGQKYQATHMHVGTQNYIIIPLI